MFWHAYPFAMEFDPHSGDYGLGFFGNALQQGGHYLQHPRLGPLCFLCSASSANSSTSTVIVPEDAYHRRMFIEPLALYIVAKAGTFQRMELQTEGSSPHLSVVLNATEWGERPWSRLQITLTKTSDSRPGSDFIVTKGGMQILATKIDANTFAFEPASDGSNTEVVVSWGKQY